MYGFRYLGAIKSMVFTVMVFGSALGPLAVGVMLESDFNWQAGMIAAIVAMTLLLIISSLALRVRKQIG
jgi:uncharacterized membrane protein YcaP (DUF421 family)